MFLRLLKNELRKKKTMNAILFVLILMASMFMASGLNNVVTLMSGTDHYFDLAGIGNYTVFVKGHDEDRSIEKLLNRTEGVTGYRIDDVYVLSGTNIQDENGEKLELNSTVLLQSVKQCSVSLFDEEDRVITEVKKGHAYVSGSVLKKNGLKAGDVILIRLGDTLVPLVLEGKMKDALFGSDMVGCTRILLSEEDCRRWQNTAFPSCLFYIDAEDEAVLNRAMSEADNLLFNEGRSTLRLCYVMDMIVAFVTLILSVCLIIVSFVTLRFSISFHILEEYREIGVMKAVGIGTRRIRFLYLGKYVALAVAGALTGFFCSIPFSSLLIRAVSGNMVLENSSGLLFYLLGSVTVAAVTVWFAFLCTGKIRKASPMDAVRCGQTGERFEKKKGCRLEKTCFGSAAFLAVNDIVSSPRRYLSMIITFCICTLLVLVLENTAATLGSDRLIGKFAVKADLYLYDLEEGLDAFAGEYDFGRRCASMEQKLKEAGTPAQVSVEVQYKYPVTVDGTDYSLTFQQGVNTEMGEYEVTEGYAPEYEDEIMITPQISELLGVKIGDTVTVHFPAGDMDCMVSGYCDSICSLGKIIRLHNDAPTANGSVSGELAYQIRFLDHSREEDLPESVLEERQEAVKELFRAEKVQTAAEYCKEITQSFDAIESVKLLLLGITFAVIFLVTALMERTFVSDEKPQIALLKATGFSDRRVVLWHGIRLALVGLIAAVLAAALSVPVTELCITPIFAMMGAQKVDFLIRPWRVFVEYPAGILLFTLAAGMLQALETGKIHCRDAAGIE